MTEPAWNGSIPYFVRLLSYAMTWTPKVKYDLRHTHTHARTRNMCLSSEECLRAVTTMIDVAPQQKLKQEKRLTHNSPKEKLIIFRQLFCGRTTNITHWTERILLASPKTQRDLTETNVNDQQKMAN